MDLELKICTDGKEWDGILEKCPQATIFHTWAFLTVSEKHSHISFLGRHRAKLYAFIAWHKEKPVGLFPVFFYKAPFLRAVFSPPLVSAATYMGPLLVDEDNMNQHRREDAAYHLVKAVDTFLHTNLGANNIKIRTSPGIIDARDFAWNGYSVSALYNYDIKVDRKPDDIFAGFEKDLRASIRKATASGLVVEEGGEEDLRIIFANVRNRYGEQGFRTETTLKFITDLYNSLPAGTLKVYVVRKDGVYQAGMLILSYRDKSLAWIGVPKTGTDGVYPNDLLLWDCARRSAENGEKVFEITWANTPRLCAYKSKFNPVSTIYFSCEKRSRLINFVYFLKDTIHFRKAK